MKLEGIEKSDSLFLAIILGVSILQCYLFGTPEKH